MNDTLILLISLSLILYALVSAKVERSPITAPMVFVLLGYLLYTFGFSQPIPISNHAVLVMSEITLMVLLFTDASRINLKLLAEKHTIPVRLLAIGMPLTIVFGFVIGWSIFKGQFTGVECFILAAILAPTDAALGLAVVTNPMVPFKIRQALNVESGLNDGIALPIILFLIAFSGFSATRSGYWMGFISLQLLLSPIIGACVGYGGGKLILLANRKNAITHSLQDLCVLALAVFAFSLSTLLNANGFIAVFVTGMVLGNCTRELCTCLYEFSEDEGQLLVLLIFLVFGAVFVPSIVNKITWPMLLYALLSLSVVRLIPVGLSLIGSHLALKTTLFLGWFGPRGLASVIFGLILIEQSTMFHKNALMDIIILTVLLSIVLHGLTAYPLSIRYGKSMLPLKEAKEDEGEGMPTRW